MKQLEFIQQARWFAERRGYRASWVYVVFRERFGTWPGKLLKEGDPQEPSPEFIEWVLAYWRSKKAEKSDGMEEPCWVSPNLLDSLRKRTTEK